MENEEMEMTELELDAWADAEYALIADQEWGALEMTEAALDN